MGCSKCGKTGVIFQDYSGLHLCKQHFKEDFLHKAKKTVRQNHWLVPGTRFAVALSGGPASCALLDFMQTLVGERKDISLIAVTIKNRGHELLENTRAMTGALHIPWFSIQEDLTEAQPGTLQDAKNTIPFPAHMLIEHQLKRMAEQLEIDALAVGYTLEDHAEWVLWNAISGNMARKSNYTAEFIRPVRIIRPFMHIPGQELDLYTQLFLNDYYMKTGVDKNTRIGDPISQHLSRFYNRHPGVPYALVNIGERVKKFRIRDLS